jgi:hypothetical protein
MKTLILSFILIFGLMAPNHGKPINDIYSVQEPSLSEEAYVNDIPFNTWEVAVEAVLSGDEVKLEEDPYVNDIPFDTKAIACKYLLNRIIETTGEVNINDIPFSTEKIYCEYLASLMTEQYRNEKNVHDLPQSPNYIICTYENGVASCVAVKVKMPRKSSFRQKKIENADYTIIYPVKLDFPKVEVNNDGLRNELLIVPGFSL